MQNRNGLTRTDVLVLITVLVVIVMIVTVVIPFLDYVKRVATKSVCATNLKGLGTAMAVYANDYEDKFQRLPGNGPWSKRLGFDYYAEPDFKGEHANVSRTISATWYLLVREADVSPKSFICPRHAEVEPVTVFDGGNPVGKDFTELWDFGHDPYKHVSYALHNPYGKFPATGDAGTSFAIAADMNPWMKDGEFVKPTETTEKNWLDKVGLMSPHFREEMDKWKTQQANAYAHGREGQNITFGDGHCSYEKVTDVGVGYDNIYTFWSSEDNPTEEDKRIGTNPTSRDKSNDAKSKEDSFLVI